MRSWMLEVPLSLRVSAVGADEKKTRKVAKREVELVVKFLEQKGFEVEIGEESWEEAK